MNNFRQYFLEKTIKYITPDDSEHLLFDFYMMDWLDNNIDANPTGRYSSATAFGKDALMDRGETERSVRPPSTTHWANLQEAKNKIIDTTKDKMLTAVLFAIVSESRHLIGQDAYEEYCSNHYGPDHKFIDPFAGPKEQIEVFLYNQKKGDAFEQDDYEKFLRMQPDMGEDSLESQLKRAAGENISMPDKLRNVRLSKTNTDRWEAWQNFEKLGLDENQYWSFVEDAGRAFRMGSDVWDESYGGEAWAAICDGWIKLDEAKSDEAKMTYIDHIYDLQHNSGTVLNKVSEWYKEEDFTWLNRALDYKFDIQDPRNLLKVVSPSMKAIAQPLIAAHGLNPEPEDGFVFDAMDIKNIMADSKVWNLNTTGRAKKEGGSITGSQHVLQHISGEEIFINWDVIVNSGGIFINNTKRVGEQPSHLQGAKNHIKGSWKRDFPELWAAGVHSSPLTTVRRDGSAAYFKGPVTTLPELKLGVDKIIADANTPEKLKDALDKAEKFILDLLLHLPKEYMRTYEERAKEKNRIETIRQKLANGVSLVNGATYIKTSGGHFEPAQSSNPGHQKLTMKDLFVLDSAVGMVAMNEDQWEIWDDKVERHLEMKAKIDSAADLHVQKKDKAGEWVNDKATLKSFHEKPTKKWNLQYGHYLMVHPDTTGPQFSAILSKAGALAIYHGGALDNPDFENIEKWEYYDGQGKLIKRGGGTWEDGTPKPTYNAPKKKAPTKKKAPAKKKMVKKKGPTSYQKYMDKYMNKGLDAFDGKDSDTDTALGA